MHESLKKVKTAFKYMLSYFKLVFSPLNLFFLLLNKNGELFKKNFF